MASKLKGIAAKAAIPAGGLAGFLLLWQLLCVRYTAEQLPSPWIVAQAFLESAREGNLLKNVEISLFRFSAAYSIAVAAGIPLGIFLGRSFTGLATLNPLLQILRPISPIAWFPLAVLWFGIGNAPAIFIIFLSAFFPILLSTIVAVRSVPQTYLKVAANFGLSKGALVLKVIVPAALPSIVVGLRIAIGTAWIHLVAGEMLGAQSGLGFMIVDARNFLRTDLIIAGMLLVGVLGLAIDSAVSFAERKIARSWTA